MQLLLQENARDNILAGPYVDCEEWSEEEVTSERNSDELAVVFREDGIYVLTDVSTELRPQDQCFLVRLPEIAKVFEGGREALERQLQEAGVEYDWFQPNVPDHEEND